ncbi:PQQ-binding-like beta-propeller repeat protein, partial [Hyphomicrobium sp.]|uniref:outer membrane protein assembly factor BamB family protein n=1 Tax=Hyphomicrobium sp. TaxID=82 RepID=UPI002D064466
MRQRLAFVAGGVAALLLGMSSMGTPALANAEIEERAKNENLWPAPGRDNKLTRHSTLSDINKDNVSKLNHIWSQSMGALRGQEGQPVVVEHNGKPMMYFSSGCPNMAQCNILQALDLSDPDNPVQVWHYVKKTDRDESAVPRACCDTIHRGVNYAANKVIYHTLDGFVIALDATTGAEVWVVKHAWPEKGETITGPTLIAENLVIAGFGGDEFAARGRLTAYNIETGEIVWKCHATGSDKDVCLTPDSNKANPHFGTYGKDIGITS